MTKRAVVVGPYPPETTPEAAATVSVVRNLTAGGTSVTVVSPQPSAAHHHADPGSSAGAARLFRTASGAGLLVARLDATDLGAGDDPRAALFARLLLGAALRRPHRVELHLDSVPHVVSPRWCALIARPAGKVTVRTEPERESLVVAGADRSRVEVQPLPSIEGRPSGQRPTPIARPRAWPDGTREELQAEIYRRAAEARLARGAIEQPADAVRPLRAMLPLGRAVPTSPKPGVGLAKRVIAKLVGWQLDPVVIHVNRLHRATQQAVEVLAERERRRQADLSQP